MKRYATTVILGALAALWAGCASTPSKFYTLSPAATPGTATAAYSVSVGPVSVPPAVARPQIVVRVGPNEVALDEFNRWASPLQSDIARVVAENLSSTLGTPRVTVFPQSATAAVAAYRAAIDVLRFESAPGDAATLDATWTVRGPKEGQSLAGRTTLREAVSEKGYAALVAAHSRALGRWSADIAGAIRTLERGGQ
jgi:uncharacterized protein